MDRSGTQRRKPDDILGFAGVVQCDGSIDRSPLTEDEVADPIAKAGITELDLAIKDRIRDSIEHENVDEELIGLFPDVPDDVPARSGGK